MRLVVPPADPGASGIDLAYEKRPVELVFPLRQGTGHVFQFLGFDFDPMSGGRFSRVVRVVVADQWRAGEAPVVTIL